VRAGGTGGAGNGGGGAVGNNATANTGSGGGGAGRTSLPSGAGGSGIVILRFPTSKGYSATGTYEATDEKATLIDLASDDATGVVGTAFNPNGTIDRFDFQDPAVNGTASTQTVAYDVGAVQGNAWTLRMKVRYTTLTAGDSEIDVGLSDTNHTAGGNGNQDFVGVRLIPASGTAPNTLFRPRQCANDEPRQGADSSNYIGQAVDTDYYLQIQRTSGTAYSVRWTTNSNYTGGTYYYNGSGTSNISGSVTDLRYIKIMNGENETYTNATGQISELKFWNSTTTSGTPTLQPSFLNVVNLEANTIFIETDTKVIHWLQDSKWIMSSPKGISDLTAWYDASDINSVTKDGSNLVSQLNDKSGNEYNLTASGTGNNGKPLWVSGGKNSLDVINFASNKIMRAQWTAKAQPTTICVVLYTPASDGGQDNLWDNYNNTESSMGFVNSDTNNRLSMFAPDNIEYPSSGATTYAQTWTFFVNTYNGSSSSMRINGVEKVGGDCGSNDSFGITLSTHRSGNNWGNIKLAEMMVFDKALSSAEIDSVNEYFSRKWGITIGS